MCIYCGGYSPYGYPTPGYSGAPGMGPSYGFPYGYGYGPGYGAGYGSTYCFPSAPVAAPMPAVAPPPVYALVAPWHPRGEYRVGSCLMIC